MTGENQPAEIDALLHCMYDKHKKSRQNIMKSFLSYQVKIKERVL